MSSNISLENHNSKEFSAERSEHLYFLKDVNTPFRNNGRNEFNEPKTEIRVMPKYNRGIKNIINSRRYSQIKYF